MKPTRHQAREVALQILYRYDMALNEPEKATADELPAFSPQATLNELNRHFDHFRVPNEIRGFAAELVAGTLRDLQSLDAILEKYASNWKLARMSYVDRNLLRMSIFEMKAFQDTPVSIVIDEAVELAKAFGTQESPGFINGVLDAVKSSVRNLTA
jgi:N utilization substance protein B